MSFLFLYAVIATGQKPPFRFEHLTTADGLSHSFIMDIVQDDLGFLWISTLDGLNRFDGHDFKVFRADGGPHNPYSNKVREMYRDSRGRIWLRYWRGGVGYFDPGNNQFHYFGHLPGNPNTLSTNFHTSPIAHRSPFYEDRKGRIWIATDKGLNVYDPATRTCEQIHFELAPEIGAQPRIRGLTGDEQGGIVFGFDRGLARYDPELQEVRLLLSVPDSDRGQIQDLYTDSKGNIWVATNHLGLYRLGPRPGRDAMEIRHFQSEIRSGSSTELGVSYIQEDHLGKIWFSSNAGLFVVDKDRPDLPRKVGPADLPPIELLFQDSRHNIWMATADDSGLWMADPEKEIFFRFQHASLDPTSLGENKVSTLFEDNKGVLWIGFKKGGMSKLDLYQKPFILYNNSKKGTEMMPGNDVYAIYLDQKKNLWLGTNNKLYRKNLDNGQQEVFGVASHRFGTPFTYDKDPEGKLVGTIEPAPDGSLWMGYFDYKISRYDPQTGRFQNFQHVEDGPGGAFRMWSVRDIEVAGDGATYFVGANGGLGKYHPGRGEFSYYEADETDTNGLADNWNYRIYEDAEGILWIGSGSQGLNRFDPYTETFTVYQYEPGRRNGPSSNSITSILERSTPRGQVLWLGTENGLNRFSVDSNRWTSYTTTEGLLGNFVHGLLADDEGRIWASTNAGLSCFDPVTEQFVNYTMADGLQANEFNEGSYFKDDAGNLYFGGVNGVTVFDPDMLKPNPFKPDLVFTSFKVGNQTVQPGDTVNGRVILDRSIGLTDHITLTHRDRLISFAFSGLHFAAPSKIKYRHRLWPYESEWNEVGARQRIINYNSIPPGNYELQLESTDLEQNWIPGSKVIKIVALPPFWKTVWFRLVLLGLIVAVIILIIHLRTRELAKKKTELARLVRDRTTELEKRSAQLKKTNQTLRDRQNEIIHQSEKIGEQRDQLEKRNRQLEQQKQEIQSMADRLHASDQSKLTFFTNISHEFRTPLSLITGQAEYLLDKPEYGQVNQVREGIRVMYRNAKRLLRLVNQLLDIRSVEAGGAQLQTIETDIACFARELFGLFQPLADRQNIELVSRIPSSGLPMEADQDKVEKILFNLLSNAFKHTPDGGRITLELEEDRDGQRVIMKVINTGAEISEDDLPRIFDRYFYTDSQNQRGALSSGIGLSLVRDLVAIHLGEIGVSQTTEGTCFTVTLPFRQFRSKARRAEGAVHPFAFTHSMLENDLEEASPTVTRPEEEDGGEGQPVILVVEDNDDLRDLLRTGLKEDHKVLLARNGQEGIDMARSESPDLIISDVMMPEVDGLSLTHTLKKDIHTSHIPIILLTAKAETEDQLAGLRRGADDYLTKPFHFELLKLKVRNIFDTRQRFRESLRESIPYIPQHLEVEPLDQGLLHRIVAIVEVHIDDTGFDGDALAKELCISKTQLYRKLKALTGMSVNIFIRTIRLKTAAQLFQNGLYRISDVAYAVGFDNPKYFAVCFKDLFQKTPTEFMNSHHEQALEK